MEGAAGTEGRRKIFKQTSEWLAGIKAASDSETDQKL